MHSRRRTDAKLCSALLKVTRSLGDSAMKPFGVCATPEVRECEAFASEPALARFTHRVGLMRKAHERFFAMLEARDAPDVYNVWRRI